MTKLARSSYILLALVLVLVGWLKLTAFALTLLFSFFALSKLYYFRRKWLAVVLFAVLMAGIAYGFGVAERFGGAMPADLMNVARLSSLETSPSRSTMTRRACAAMSGSWVTMITV